MADMFVVQIIPPIAGKTGDLFLNTKGKKTPYLGQAQVYPTEDAAKAAGEKFILGQRGFSFSVNPF